MLFYQLSISLYVFAIKIVAWFNPKAKLWLTGRKEVWEQLKKVNSNENNYWFHCASLGELEQAKPLMEQLKKQDGSIKIIITVFSPSGYAPALRYVQSDTVCYLPIDTLRNAKRFIAAVNPKKVFFVKYEFWYYHLSQLAEQNIPTYLISGVFRKNQLFFKWYGGTHRQMLSFFMHFFVQNESSKKMLQQLGYNNVTITGDTRLDRVYENAQAPQALPLIKAFAAKKPTLVLGSSWSKEEKLLAQFIQTTAKDLNYIVAPHSIEKARLTALQKTFQNINCINYSDATMGNIDTAKVLIIDNIGMLANIYQYTDIAFVGGGFSGALHNILEPASFGNALLFGNKHQKFHEAAELIKLGGAFAIKNLDELTHVINALILDKKLAETQRINRFYVANGRGATAQIIHQLNR